MVLGDENKKIRQVQEEQPDEAVVLKKKEKRYDRRGKVTVEERDLVGR